MDRRPTETSHDQAAAITPATVATVAHRTLSVVVPTHDEQDVILAFHTRLITVLDGLGIAAEIIYVDDGSSDTTARIITDLHAADGRVALLQLSRQFGKEAALSAGLDHACGDAVVVIDADLQDPPELIPALIAQWHAGYDVVYAQRSRREQETWIKRASAHTYYRLLSRLSPVRIPHDTGDFRLMSARAVVALRTLREQHRYMKGLFAWVGYPQVAVRYVRHGRHAGRSQWNWLKLFGFAIDGITSFSIAPLRLASYLGLAASSAAFAYGLYIIYKTIAVGEPVRGFPTLMVAILFLGGMQLLCLGIIGEYVGRTYGESKRRPLYFVARRLASKLAARQSSCAADDH